MAHFETWPHVLCRRQSRCDKQNSNGIMGGARSSTEKPVLNNCLTQFLTLLSLSLFLSVSVQAHPEAEDLSGSPSIEAFESGSGEHEHGSGHGHGSGLDCTPETCSRNMDNPANAIRNTAAATSTGKSLMLSLVGSYDLLDTWLNVPCSFFGDITLYKNMAVMGSRCVGVYIFDVSNPKTPLLLSNVLDNVAPSIPGLNFEDVEVARIGNQDILVVGLQGLARGIVLYDISNPSTPVPISQFNVPGTSGVHEFTVGKAADGSGRTLAFLAALNTENLAVIPPTGRQGDTFIVDISDPYHPTQIGEWGFRDEPLLGDALANIITLNLGGSLHGSHHSARLSLDGKLLHVSHWDGGFITLNVQDPAHPTLVSRLLKYEELVPNEALLVSAHSMAEANNGKILLTGQEHFTGRALRGLISSTALAYPVFPRPPTLPNGTLVPANGYPDARVVEGEVVHAVVNCTSPSIDPSINLNGKIALIPASASCANPGDTALFLYKVAAGQKTGAKAVIIYDDVVDNRVLNMLFNSTGIVVDGVPVTITIPSFGMIARNNGLALKNAPAPVQAKIEVYDRPTAWGKLGIWNNSNPANPILLSSITSDAPLDALSSRTVHNPEPVGSLVYTSWSNDGFKVVDIADPVHPFVAASFQPNSLLFLGEPEPDYIWGVKPKGNYAYLSNGYSGLQVLKAMYFTGFAAPVDNTKVNTVKAGQAVPLKWRLTGANDGAPIADLANVAVTTTNISCATRTPLPGTPVVEKFTGNTGLMNLGLGNYQINWKTSKAYAGTCKRLRLDFGGGAYQTVDFKFN